MTTSHTIVVEKYAQKQETMAKQNSDDTSVAAERIVQLEAEIETRR